MRKLGLHLALVLSALAIVLLEVTPVHAASAGFRYGFELVTRRRATGSR